MNVGGMSISPYGYFIGATSATGNLFTSSKFPFYGGVGFSHSSVLHDYGMINMLCKSV